MDESGFREVRPDRRAAESVSKRPLKISAPDYCVLSAVVGGFLRDGLIQL